MSPKRIEVSAVESKSDLKRFVDFQYRLYKGNPYFVPPIRSAELEIFSPRNNPAYEHCESKLFIASRKGQIIGRIAGIINHLENNGSEKRTARFGWVDFIDEKAVSTSLFEAVESWAKQRGCQIIKGPYGFSNMDKAGLLTSGYEELATMAGIYNYPYYVDHIVELGYEKLVDWKEFEASVPDSIPERVIKFADMIRERYQLTEFQTKDKHELNRIGHQIFDLINLTYKDLEGFIPHSKAQIDLFVKRYLGFVNPDFISIVLDNQSRLAGFGIAMPSFSRALQKAGGRILPFGIFHLRRAMKKNDRVDLYLIAVRPDLQNKGITALIFKKIIQTCNQYGITKAETNPELESNHDVQNLWRGYEMRQHKKRRSYQKELN